MIFTLALLILLASGQPAQACEPVVPLMMVFGGNFMYALAGLPLVIALKCLVFARLEPSLPRKEAVACMAKGNLYSTLFGFLAWISFAAPPLILISPVLVFFAALAPSERIRRYANWGVQKPRAARALIALVFAFAFLGTIVLFAVADQALGTRNFALYWLLKLAFVTVGLVFSILLSACWEERVVAGLAAKGHPEASYFVPVLRANYVAFIVLLFIGAALTLPTRLKTPGYLFSY